MQGKRDILFLCQFFYPEYVSSATLPFDTAIALKNAGYTVDALCGYPKEYSTGEKVPWREEKDGICIRRLAYLQMSKQSKLGRLVNYLSFTIAAMLHLFTLARYRVVIVYSNPPLLPWVAALAKQIFQTKLIFVAYDLYPELAIVAEAAGEGGMISRVMRHINHVVFSRADCVVALSSEMRRYILKNRTVAGETVTVIPNWYQDMGVAGSAGAENRFYQDYEGRFVVSYLGNMGTVQDMDTILEAARLLRDDSTIRFLLAGHGNKLEKLRQTVCVEGLENVKVLDFLHGKDFQDALEISDCAVVSLIQGSTGLCVPSKTYSYMMRGIPLLVIMEDSDIARDVESGAGVRVKNGDATGMAAAICRMRDNPDILKAMRCRCRSVYLENYTAEIAAKRYVDMLRAVLSENTCGKA